MNRATNSVKLLVAFILLFAGRGGCASLRSSQLASYSDEAKRALSAIHARQWLQYASADELARNADAIAQDAARIRALWRSTSASWLDTTVLGVPDQSNQLKHMTIEAEQASLRAKFEAKAARTLDIAKDFGEENAKELFKLAVCVAGGMKSQPVGQRIPSNLGTEAYAFVRDITPTDDISAEALQAFMRELCSKL